jgi:hypothetical protein
VHPAAAAVTVVQSAPVRPSPLALSLLLACTPTPGAETDDAETGATTVPTDGGEVGEVNFDCDGYCTRITDNCTAARAQYPNKETCMSTCAHFPQGQESDMTGNSLGCRLYHAGAAADAPDTHCTHAGPGGNGQCGSNCEGFCTVAAAACPAVYPELALCVSTCADFNDAEPFDASDLSGDTLACRLYHLTVATMFAEMHCPHTAAISDPCG